MADAVLSPSNYGINPGDTYYPQLDMLYRRIASNPSDTAGNLAQKEADTAAYKNVLSSAVAEKQRNAAVASTLPATTQPGPGAQAEGGGAPAGAAKPSTGAVISQVATPILTAIGGPIGAAVGALGSLLCGGKGSSKATAAKQAPKIAADIGAGNVAKYFSCSRRTTQVDTNPASPTYGFCVGTDENGNAIVEPPVIAAQQILDELGDSLPPQTRDILQQLASQQSDDKKKMILYGSLILGAAGIGIYVVARRRKGSREK